MARYVWTGKGFVDKHSGLEMHKPYAGQICKPTIQGDIAEYVSPITGKPIDGRTAQRDDLARSGCRVVDPSENEMKFKSKRYAKANNALDLWTGERD